MKTNDIDIIMPLKRAIMNEELRYTLRSIALNFPHRHLWLSGYQPSWVYNVKFIPVSIPYGPKYLKGPNNTLAACRNASISEDFILFNDDFFVMKRIDDFKVQHRGKLIDYLKTLRKENGHHAATEVVYDTLQKLGIKDPINYELHTPMLMNRTKLLEAWRQHLKLNPNSPPTQLRSLYGNLYNVGGEEIPDVKVYGFEEMPNGSETYISTNDDSFAQGKIGEYLRAYFMEPCKYEKDS